jgi:hypothetical protein
MVFIEAGSVLVPAISCAGINANRSTDAIMHKMNFFTLMHFKYEKLLHNKGQCILAS